MPTKTKTTNTNEVIVLRKRVSALNDRVLVLEKTIQRTQELIQKDMSRLVEMFQKSTVNN